MISPVLNVMEGTRSPKKKAQPIKACMGAKTPRTLPYGNKDAGDAIFIS
jgi:hypothetical protein